MIELWVGFGVLILGSIFSVIAFFLKRLIEGFEKKIDLIDGKIEFLVLRATTTEGDIAQIKQDVSDIYEEIESAKERYDRLHDRVLVIETQHIRNRGVTV